MNEHLLNEKLINEVNLEVFAGRVCEHCRERSFTTVQRANPFVADVHNEELMEDICDQCYTELCNDI